MLIWREGEHCRYCYEWGKIKCNKQAHRSHTLWVPPPLPVLGIHLASGQRPNLSEPWSFHCKVWAIPALPDGELGVSIRINEVIKGLEHHIGSININFFFPMMKLGNWTWCMGKLFFNKKKKKLAEGSRFSFKGYNVLAYLLYGKNIKKKADTLCSINLPFTGLPYFLVLFSEATAVCGCLYVLPDRWKNPWYSDPEC